MTTAGKRQREIGPKRRATKTRDPIRTIVIVCEGSKTEKIYFQRFKERNSGVRIEVPNADKYTDPINLVKYAADYAKKNDIDVAEGDSIWVVYDVDQNKDEGMAQAKKLADQYKIGIAHSNPSFELWYLLHFEKSSAMLTNAELSQKLQRHLPRYNKSTCVFDDIMEHRPKAIKHAEQLNHHHMSLLRDLTRRESNPSTQVFRLVQHIDEIKRANQQSRPS